MQNIVQTLTNPVTKFEHQFWLLFGQISQAQWRLACN